MSQAASDLQVKTERSFPRFTLGQRWEHAILILTSSVLLLTGLPQKYRTAVWSQQLLATPERLELIQDIHHIAAVGLILEVIYHVGRALVLLTQRRLPGDMFPTWGDIRDAFAMVKYLLFLTEEKPGFGKYNYEQKFTYWLIVVAVGIMIFSGLILWFPVIATRFLPGGIVPAAKFAHSTEAIITAIFVILWHFYHVHVERLNLSIFTGRLSEQEMQEFHSLEYERLMAASPRGEQEAE